jgi:hypothetical protein
MCCQGHSFNTFVKEHRHVHRGFDDGVERRKRDRRLPALLPALQRLLL